MRRLKKKKSRKWYSPKVIKKMSISPIFSQGCDLSDITCTGGQLVLKS